MSRVEGLDQGADAYVDKPFNLEELEARIASLIANRIRVRGKFTGVQEQEDTVRKIELKGNDAALMEKIMKAVNDRFRKEVDSYNKFFGDYEKVKRFELVDREWTIDEGEVTPSLKIRRKIIAEHFKDLIEGMFAE